jgi:metal-responsive CopG/Arc/MetJ family transcriptional regulator
MTRDDSVRDMAPREGYQQVLVRLPSSMIDEIDKRRESIGETSRAAWMERALRWALDQPVITQRVEVEVRT